MIDSPKNTNALSSAEIDEKLNSRELAVEIISVAGKSDMTDNICLYHRDNEFIVVAHPNGIKGFLNEDGTERPFYSVPASRCYCNDKEVSEEDGYGKPLTWDFAEYGETVEAIAKEIQSAHDKVFSKPEPGSFEEIEVALRDKLACLIEDAIFCRNGGHLQSRWVYRKGAELAVAEVEESHYGTTGLEEKGYSFVVAVDDMTVNKDEVDVCLRPTGALIDKFLDLARENILDKERVKTGQAYEQPTDRTCTIPDFSNYLTVIKPQPDLFRDFTLKDGETAEEVAVKWAKSLTIMINFGFPGILTRDELRDGNYFMDEALSADISRWVEINFPRSHK